jgi:hypothetical protein
MRIPAILFVCAAAVAPLQAAHAANEWVLMSNDNSLNSATVEVQGDSNTLHIVQDHLGAGGANTLSVTIDGDFNGGPLNAEFSGAALLPGLAPGSLIQRGYGNSMSFEVSGSHNLFAAAQIGNNNAILASITGTANQASVMQNGNNNFVAFSQNGIGNTVSVTQTSW